MMVVRVHRELPLAHAERRRRPGDLLVSAGICETHAADAIEDRHRRLLEEEYGKLEVGKRRFRRAPPVWADSRGGVVDSTQQEAVHALSPDLLLRGDAGPRRLRARR